MILRLVRAVVALAFLLIPVGLLVGARVWLERYEMAVTPWMRDAGPKFVTVPSGARAVDAIRALHDAGVVRNAQVTLEVLRKTGKARSIHAGEYRFERPLTPLEVLHRLIDGRVFLRQITFPEGLTRFQVAERYEAAGLGTAADLLAASADPLLIADLDPAAVDLEGYLFPDTYALGRTDGAEALVRRMVEGYRRAVGPDPATRAAASGRSLRAVTILASLVERETAEPEERALVAGVYQRRLERGMLLQADPTVIYGLIVAGRFDGNLTRAHLRESFPYNTYKIPGLPPGPIANPGRSALDAAFAPAATEFIYFVSKNDGSHVFARSLAEHNRNVNEYQKKYWRERWRRERADRK